MNPNHQLLSVPMNHTKLLVRSAALASLAFVLTGCVAAIGNGPSASRATVGQQLVDLKRAHDAGAINPAEYEAQRARILGQK